MLTYMGVLRSPLGQPAASELSSEENQAVGSEHHDMALI